MKIKRREVTWKEAGQTEAQTPDLLLCGVLGVEGLNRVSETTAHMESTYSIPTGASLATRSSLLLCRLLPTSLNWVHKHCLCRFRDVVKIDWCFSCFILCTELRCQHLWPTVVSGKLKQSFSSVCGPTLWNNIIKQCSEIVGKLGRDPGTPEPQRKQTLLLFVFRFFKCDAVPPSHLAFWQELDGGLPG